MELKQDYLCKLAELSLKIANIVDRQGENDDFRLADSLGLGYRALSSYLRQGVKAISEIQERYSIAHEKTKLAEISERDARNFLIDIFGDEDIDSVSDESKAKIKEFISTLLYDDDDDTPLNNDDVPI